MPGGKSHDFDITYISARRLLRTAAAAESDPSAIAAAELVTLSTDRHGYNGRIFIVALLPGTMSSATVSVYLDVLGDGVSWALAESVTVAASTLVQFTDLPPGNYAVLLTALTGSGTATFYEQHTA